MTGAYLDLTGPLTHEGYLNVRAVPGRGMCGLLVMLYTTGLYVCLTRDSWLSRYCYENFDDAAAALEQWDGQGDPPGPWIVEKPAGRVGPGA
jgi:hypothetical protein